MNTGVDSGAGVVVVNVLELGERDGVTAGVGRCHRKGDGLGAAVASGIGGDHIKVVSGLGTGVRGGVDEHLACGAVDAEAASITATQGEAEIRGIGGLSVINDGARVDAFADGAVT